MSAPPNTPERSVNFDDKFDNSYKIDVDIVNKILESKQHFEKVTKRNENYLLKLMSTKLKLKLFAI